MAGRARAFVVRAHMGLPLFVRLYRYDVCLYKTSWIMNYLGLNYIYIDEYP